MERGFVLLRCEHCGSVNRVKQDKLSSCIRCGSCKENMNLSDNAMDIEENEFDREVLKWPGVVLVEFYSDSCGYCRQLDPVLRELAQDYKGIIKVVQINTARAANLAGQFQLRGVPAMYLYDKGRLIGNLPGYVAQTQLESWIKSFLPI